MLDDKLMYKFLSTIKRKKLMTLFLSNLIFPSLLNDNNYICRLIKKDGIVILDVYDNISKNRFNRYIFDFVSNKKKCYVEEIDNVFVNYIYINSLTDSYQNLFKFGYMFRLPYDKMAYYAENFLPKKIVDVLVDIIK